jgi:hypothetical protein
MHTSICIIVVEWWSWAWLCDVHCISDNARLTRLLHLCINAQSEYDIAVIETQARRPVSVKVKQFSLQGARVQNDWQGPQMVKYKNKLHPWKYIVVLPVARNPIKISSPSLASLKAVHEGIRRVLVAQQRDRGGRESHASSGAPASYRPERHEDYHHREQERHDDYRSNGGHGNGHGGGGYDEPYQQNGHGGGGYNQSHNQQAAYRY